MSKVDDKKKQAEQLREQMLQVIAKLDVETLAVAAKHEYDDTLSVVVPGEESAGATLLRDGRDAFIAWVRREGRWPSAGTESDEASATWHHDEATPHLRAQAFVDLGLYHSQHAAFSVAATITGIQQTLDLAAEQLAFTLASEYGPMV